MALIQPVPTQQATGIVRQGYDMFMQNIGTIPRPMEVLSVSPALFEIQLQRIGYFAKHPTLSYALLVHIRYLASHSLDYKFCTDFNRHLLHKQGLTDDDIRQLEDDPTQALLEEHETAMLVFVMKAMKAPGTITAADTQHLRELGWNDRDMVDALAQGVGMIDHAIMMEAFQIDQQCLMG